MLSYKETRPWAKAIKAAVVSRTMPPWFADPQYGHFNNDRSLKQHEIDTIAAWVDNGAPEGDPRLAPPPLEWPEGGWQIKPDVTVDLPPYPVAARGIVEWERIAFPSPFKEDTWVTSVEILPGVPAVVHHMCFGFQKHRATTPYNEYQWMEVPRDDEGNMKTVDGTTTGPLKGTVLSRAAGSTEVKRREGSPTVFHEGTNEFCYLPGLPYEDYRPVNAGMLVPAGSDMIVSLHYTATGLAVVDRSRIGFTVTKTPPPKKFLPQDGAEGENPPVARKQANATLAIPPYASDHPGPLAEVSFLKDVELVWFRPHAHVRGKTVRYTLVYPDGREETVLYVPRYNFNWQLTYRTSLKIPEGLQDARPVHVRQLDGQQVQPRSRQVGPLRRSELGGNGNPEHGLPGRSGRRRQRLHTGALSEFNCNRQHDVRKSQTFGGSQGTRRSREYPSVAMKTIAAASIGILL